MAFAFTGLNGPSKINYVDVAPFSAVRLHLTFHCSVLRGFSRHFMKSWFKFRQIEMNEGEYFIKLRCM